LEAPLFDWYAKELLIVPVSLAERKSLVVARSRRSGEVQTNEALAARYRAA
jgi:hypothetical protein